jgi:hypothetical protein
VLYRCFDSYGRLLYVGITHDFTKRRREHRARSAWWPQVARVSTVIYPLRNQALVAERIAVRTELPVYNVVYALASGAPHRVAVKSSRYQPSSQTTGIYQIMETFRAAIQRADDARDADIRAASAGGMRQVDIIKATGLSRETIRLILNPDARAQLQARRRPGTVAA